MLDLTKPVQTRDGRAVRILSTEAPGRRSVICAVSALIKRPGYPNEAVRNYGPDGVYGFDKPNLDLVNVPEKPTALSFSQALQALKDGEKIARAGWNGKGMWLYLVPENHYPAQTGAVRKRFGAMVPYQAYVAMVTADGTVVPWLCSQTDLLADDWAVL